ncbi:conserved hypothetical protein [Xanthomonas phaseoli pv. phaseoli]|uniref:Uncharacterized protein n=1 Tax=Xanthomonas campestris pv. phaseoli TaxID=317013 RepID=A0AB38DWW0_XANCH|nr:conserved hypothetical protein [Xanthomonas phaseoli pv. phaseoli]SON80618.1 conserved hypothetical protein [Xanthomonas phaseoli pv. phaseoli]SON85282.1 conserved hypothetical protein [Xanthomonas phaseoli pv. phaseoli]SOO31628.1 hypothetical protein XAP6164_570005 [Xanthomonas phaseoli pv. phaseoli]
MSGWSALTLRPRRNDWWCGVPDMTAARSRFAVSAPSRRTLTPTPAPRPGPRLRRGRSQARAPMARKLCLLAPVVEGRSFRR